VEATVSRQCGATAASRRLRRAFAKSHAVSVNTEKYGGDSTHPMGRVSGNAISGVSPGDVLELHPHAAVETIGDVDLR
jgi:hypothetical protein